MKKILSLVMVVAMLFAVLAFVGCDETPAETTNSSSSSVSENATNGTTESSTTQSTTESTTETTTETTTTYPVFARFDFGTDSKAIADKQTSHEFLVDSLTYSEAFISVEWTADSIIITALQDHPEIKGYIPEGKDYEAEDFNHGGTEAVYSALSYALCYDAFDIYTFDRNLTKLDKYMRVRLINNTDNNIIGFSFGDSVRSPYATNMTASCMYLQGGAPSVRDVIAGDNKLTCEPVEVYKTYTYDIDLVMALTRYAQRGEKQAYYSFADYACGVGQGVYGTGSNNWNWIDHANGAVVDDLRFFFLGAYAPHFDEDYFDYADTRANIKAGESVEVDYVLFGSSSSVLNKYQSNIESASISESNSIKESISISESIAAAATATTAAA